MEKKARVRKPVLTSAKAEGAIGEADLDRVAGSGGGAGVNPSRN
jgi:hypothetical protein